MIVDLSHRSGIENRLRFQMPGVILCGTLPYWLRNVLADGDLSPKILMISVIGTLAASLTGLFLVRNVDTYPGAERSAYIVPSLCLSFGCVLAVFFFGRIEYSRSMFILGFVLNVLYLYALYFLAQRRRRYTVGIVPGGDTARLNQLEGINWIELASPARDLQHLTAVVADLRVDLSDEWDRQLADFALAGVPVYHSKHLYESLTGRVELEHLSENSFGMLSPSLAYMKIKHVVDWITACGAMIILLPAVMVIAVAIMVDSPGAPIYRQRRVGYRGKRFTMWKLRTMTSAASSTDSRLAAMTASRDVRITRIGGPLRKMRLDELPQIINVLMGEMSWIGPRPEAEELSQWYEGSIAFYRYRHIVKPGITGWAQVNQGHVAEVDDVRDKLHYDFFYIKNFSPWIDVLIVARTVHTMLTGFGAR